MNKYVKILVSIIILLNAFACANKIVIRQTDTDKSVQIKMNKKYKEITGIKFPFSLTIENTSYIKKEIFDIEYIYSFRRKGASIEMYENDQEISNNGIRTIKGKKTLKYLVYTRHLIDSSIFTQQQLRPYLEKMLALNQDTLHIGTIDEFRAKHNELFKMLTENDTISIRYIKGKNSGLGERIAIPANW